MLAPNPVKSSVAETLSVAEILRSYACGPVPLPSDPDAAYHHHLVFDHMIDPAKGSMRQCFQGLARAIRDVLVQRWLRPSAYYRANPKRVYYLSMEFLIGPMMANNILNLSRCRICGLKGWQGMANSNTSPILACTIPRFRRELCASPLPP